MPGQFNHAKNSDQVSIRVPLRMRIHLQRLATDNERPIAAEIRMMMKNYLEAHPVDEDWLDEVVREIEQAHNTPHNSILKVEKNENA